MKYTSTSPQEYIDQLDGERKKAISKIRKTIVNNLPPGFEEQISYGMLGFVVPLHTYPRGYHANPKLPLPFINLGSQKNHIALYHYGLYADSQLMDWFVESYPAHTSHKLNKGKSCIRFAHMNDIPYSLIADLCTKVTPQQWIDLYENRFKKQCK